MSRQENAERDAKRDDSIVFAFKCPRALAEEMALAARREMISASALVRRAVARAVAEHAA
jgi:hypothetical protein